MRSRISGWKPASLVALVALALSGCGMANFSAHDLRLESAGNTLYVFTRNSGVSRNFCASLGGDVTGAETRLASADSRTIRVGRVTGCYTVRHIIVCAEGDLGCVTHEERHRHEGDFHN
jgi:hypothetical protein